ncbi:trimeric dUTPase [Halovirus HCTV-5]|uniref:dCTP deaminase n=1 Tax=Halovirus HCTV-5 TaxID=1273748 RepID=UPI00033482F4|nr:dCTP deaminase [Halovirus HCTV-5]AGM11757.1 trimeric dUTPase [Halovirus HCTV-5]
MALADHEIASRIHYHEDDLDISPYDETNLQPASYDLRLGREFKVLKRPSLWERVKHGVLSRIPFSNVDPAHRDPRDEETTERHVRLQEGESFILGAHDFVLAHTQEAVRIPDDVVGVVHGRSSWARLGVDPHLGGYIDPGFHGQITLELCNQTDTPIKLYVGQRFCQLAFHEMNEAASDPYDGKYQGDAGAHGTRLHDEDDDAPPSVETFFSS